MKKVLIAIAAVIGGMAIEAKFDCGKKFSAKVKENLEKLKKNQQNENNDEETEVKE